MTGRRLQPAHPIVPSAPVPSASKLNGLTLHCFHRTTGAGVVRLSAPHQAGTFHLVEIRDALAANGVRVRLVRTEGYLEFVIGEDRQS